MIVLGIDTATRQSSVALGTERGTSAHMALAIGRLGPAVGYHAGQNVAVSTQRPDHPQMRGQEDVSRSRRAGSM